MRHAGEGCGGRNIAPALAWRGAPAGTQSYAILCIDPDARIEGGWWHWAVHDIPADVTSLPEGGRLPGGAHTWRNDYRALRWDGPCPPPGPTHHYVFTVFALDVPSLQIPGNWPKGRVKSLIQSHALAEGSLTGTFRRSER